MLRLLRESTTRAGYYPKAEALVERAPHPLEGICKDIATKCPTRAIIIEK
jgi:ferredoxin